MSKEKRQCAHIDCPMMGSGMGNGRYSLFCQFHRKAKNKYKDHPYGPRIGFYSSKLAYRTN